MANTQAFCNSAKVELMSGNMAIGTCDQTRTISNKDTFKAALYLATATRNKSDTIYSVTGEVTGTNYSAGGVAVTNATEPALDADTAHWTPSASIVYSNVTLATDFDAVLIYNDSWTTKYALSVHTFGSQTVTAGDFTLTMPTNDGTTGLVRLA